MDKQNMSIGDRREVVDLTFRMARIAEQLVGIVDEFNRMGLDANDYSTLEPHIRSPKSRSSKKIMKLLRQSADLMQRGKVIQDRLIALGVPLKPEDIPEQPSMKGVVI